MNGVRRFLSSATGSSPPKSATEQPLPSTSQVLFSPSNGPSWPPQTPSQMSSFTTLQQGPIPNDVGNVRQQPTPPPLDDERPTYYGSSDSSFHINPGSSPPNSRIQPERLVIRKNPFGASQSQPPLQRMDKRVSNESALSGPTSTKDELFLSLLSAQAVVDSKDYEILSSEDIEELQKEHEILHLRVEGMAKKLVLETKIRDAALSLSKIAAPSKKSDAKEKLDAANERLQSLQQEYWRNSERANEVYKKLLEHRAGVLSYSLKSLEKKTASDTANTSFNGVEDTSFDGSIKNVLLSPTSTNTTSSSASTKVPFDGRHFFAGHADAITPKAQMANGRTAQEVIALEEKLKAATEALTEAGKKQAEMSRELSILKLEKQEIEVTMGMDLQAAEERIEELEKDTPRLDDLDAEIQDLQAEKASWELEREELESRLRDLQSDQATKGGVLAAGSEELTKMRSMLREREEEVRQLTAQWNAERAVWEQQKAEMEHVKKEEISRLKGEMALMRDHDVNATREAQLELDQGLNALQTLVKSHGIVLFSRDSSLQSLLASVGTHLEGVHKKLENYAKAEADWDATRRKLEEDVRSGYDRREELYRDLESTRKERDHARSESISTATRPSFDRDRPSPPSRRPTLEGIPDSAERIVQILMPIWNILPSPEARAAKFGNRQLRSGSPVTNSPTTATISLGSPGAPNSAKPASSLSELDVRSLKSLYDASRNNGQPMSPVVGGGDFSIEAFASRVQALIQDDRALIERLVRFAQAHDLLKKNAERAQKLAQDGNMAMETYQKQVRTLEDRNIELVAKQATVQDEFQQLQIIYEQCEVERQRLQGLSIEQTKSLEQLKEANDALSARTLSLAEEAANASEMTRKQFEVQMAELSNALRAAEKEVENIRESEQIQRIELLNDLNSAETENGQLRAQLRARK